MSKSTNYNVKKKYYKEIFRITNDVLILCFKCVYSQFDGFVEPFKIWPCVIDRNTSKRRRKKKGFRFIDDRNLFSLSLNLKKKKIFFSVTSICGGSLQFMSKTTFFFMYVNIKMNPYLSFANGKLP